MMRQLWKIFEKITKDLNFDQFRDPKWPRNGTSEADIQHTSRNSSNLACKPRLMWNQWELFEKITRKKNKILTYLAAQNDPMIRPLRSTFCTALQSSCNEYVKQYWYEPVETFGENNQRPKFWPILGPKNHTFEAHILHTTKNTSNVNV